jgi:hypothetical protein
MSDLAREIEEITARYKREMVALTERYLKELEALKAQLGREIAESETGAGNLKEKIEMDGPTYFS